MNDLSLFSANVAPPERRLCKPKSSFPNSISTSASSKSSLVVLYERSLFTFHSFSVVFIFVMALKHGSHLSHLFEKPSISTEKSSFSIERPGISIEKPSFSMWKWDLDRKTKYFNLKNQVFRSLYRKSMFFHQAPENQWSTEKPRVMPPSSSH